MKASLRRILAPSFAIVALVSSPAWAKEKEKADPTQRISLRDSPESSDCPIHLDLPKSWARLPDKRGKGNLVFRSENGTGSIVCSLSATKSFDGGPDELSDEKAAELLAPDNLRDQIVSSSSHVVKAEPHAIAGKPGGCIISDIPADPATGNPPRRAIVYATLDHHDLVLISFQFHGGIPNVRTLDEAQKANMPTFETILKSIVREPRAGTSKPAAGPADEVARRNENHELTQALEASIDQATRLARIERDFPELRDQVREAAATYEASVFGKGSQGAIERLRELQGAAEFDKAQTKLLEERRKTTAGTALTAAEASKYLAELKTRAARGPDGDLLAILLAMNPDFREHPEREVASGWTQHLTFADVFPLEDYKTGVDLPASWVKLVNRKEEPNVTFVSGYGYGPVTCVIRARKALPAPLGDAEAAAMFTPEQLKAGTVGENATILSSGPCEVTGHPGGWLHTQAEKPAPGLARHTTTYLTFEGPYLIRMDFSLMDEKIAPLTAEEADNRWNPLFEAILRGFKRDPRTLPASAKDSLERSEARNFLDTLKMLKRQSFVLDRIATDFPGFQDRAKEVKAAFAASPYGKSEDVLLAELTRLQGDDFKTKWEDMLKQWQEEIRNAPVSGITPDKYLDTVTGYAKGGFAESIRQTLCATNREFRENPAAELSAGCIRPVTLADDFKSPEGKAGLSFPSSWRVSRIDKSGPEMPVLSLRSANGLGDIVCILRINKASNPAAPTDEQTTAFFDPETRRKANTDPTMAITDAVRHPVAGKPGLRILADATDPHGRKKTTTPTATYMTFAGPYLINASFSLIPIDEAKPAGKIEEQLPFFDAILDTLVRG
ncbi:MAG: hypothetical protein QM755_21800 [Luteolibacter sp.]